MKKGFEIPPSIIAASNERKRRQKEGVTTETSESEYGKTPVSLQKPESSYRKGKEIITPIRMESKELFSPRRRESKVGSQLN
jgi:hypothetical protein